MGLLRDLGQASSLSIFDVQPAFFDLPVEAKCLVTGLISCCVCIRCLVLLVLIPVIPLKYY